MSSATCPKCCRPVTLPRDPPPAAWVRCPLCRLEYRLQEAVEFVPLALEVVPEPTTVPPITVDRDENQSIPDLLINPEAASVAQSESGDAVLHSTPAAAGKWSPGGTHGLAATSHERPFSPGSSSAPSWPARPAGVATPTFPATPGRSAALPSRRKNRSNPIFELAKIVIGGIAAVPIAFGILLWVFKVDPFKIAKHLPAFMVPEQMRSADSTGTTSSEPAGESPPALPKRDAENIPADKRADPFANYQPPGVAEKSTANPATTVAPAINRQPMAQGPKAGQIYSLTDTTAALAATNDAAMRMATAEKNQTDDAEIEESRQRFYASLAKLAETATLLRGDAGDQQAVQSAAAEMLRNLFGDQERLATLGTRGAAEFANSMRASNGIVLAGIVEEVRSLDDQFRTFVRLAGKESPISVITAQKPGVSTGDTAIAAGIVVDGPNQNIAGYDGPDERVVWAGLMVKSSVPLANGPR
jgi:hypothetical protein